MLFDFQYNLYDFPSTVSSLSSLKNGTRNDTKNDSKNGAKNGTKNGPQISPQMKSAGTFIDKSSLGGGEAPPTP